MGAFRAANFQAKAIGTQIHCSQLRGAIHGSWCQPQIERIVAKAARRLMSVKWYGIDMTVT